MTHPKLKSLIANYVGKTAAELSVTDGVTTVDLVGEAINTAKRHLQAQHDFEACRKIGKLTFAATAAPVLNTADLADMVVIPLDEWDNVGAVTAALNGSGSFTVNLTQTLTAGDTIRFTSDDTSTYTVTAGPYSAGTGVEVFIIESIVGDQSGFLEVETDPATMEVKRIEHAYWSDSFIPIEFLSREQYNARVRQFTGHSITNTYTPDLAVIVQHGESLQLFEGNATITVADSFYFDVVRFLPDYDTTVTTDWFLTNAWEFLQWQAIIEINKYTKEFVAIEEGNLEEPAQRAADALSAAIARDNAYRVSIPPRAPFSYPASKIGEKKSRQ